MTNRKSSGGTLLFGPDFRPVFEDTSRIRLALDCDRLRVFDVGLGPETIFLRMTLQSLRIVGRNFSFVRALITVPVVPAVPTVPLFRGWRTCAARAPMRLSGSLVVIRTTDGGKLVCTASDFKNQENTDSGSTL